MGQVDGLSAYKKGKSDEYYENYDRIFGVRDKARGHKVIPSVEADGTEGDMDESESRPEARPNKV